MITVIIPTYNSAQFILKAVRSVCTQTVYDLEVLVVDDGSTDDTPAIMRSVEDKRVRYIRTETNRGNYHARNLGLQEARGEFITFLDADDVFLPDKCLKQLKKFIENPALGLCCTGCYMQYVGREDQLIIDQTFSFQHDFDTERGFIERAIENNFIATSTVMIRRACIERLGLFDTTFQNAMDYELWLRIIFNFPAYYMCEPLIIRLEHASNISKNKINTFKALLYIFSRRLEVFSKGKFYKPAHAAFIKTKWRKSMYYLGLEYLAGGHYQEAYQCLTESKYSEKHLFRMFARLAAKAHSPFLASFVIFYRWRMQQQQILKNLVQPKAGGQHPAGNRIHGHDTKRHYSGL